MNQRIYFAIFVVASFLLTCCGQARQDQKKKHFVHMGNVAVKEKLFPEAIRYYLEAIQADSSYAQAYNNLGIVYTKTARLAKAWAAFDQAIISDPNFVDAYYNRANVRIELRDFKLALSDLNHIKSIYKDSLSIYFSKGIAFFGLHQYDSATICFSKVVEIDDLHVEGYLNLASTYYYMKNYDKSAELANKSLSIYANSPDAHNILGMVSMKLDKPEEAMKYYNEGLKYEFNNAFLLNNRGYLYLLENDLDLALADINESIVISPENPWSYRNKGIYYFQKGDYENAERLFNQAMQLDSQIELGHYYLGQIYRQNGDMSKACDSFRISNSLGEVEGNQAYQLYCAD